MNRLGKSVEKSIRGRIREKVRELWSIGLISHLPDPAGMWLLLYWRMEDGVRGRVTAELYEKADNETG